MKKFEMFNIICNNCNLTSKEKLVAHYFVYRSNQAGICYPAVNTIANHCGVSERTIQRATKKLQERGYIIISKRDIKGRQTSNEYKLILDPNKIATVSEIEIVDTPVCDSKEEQMKVVLLEDILMKKLDQSVNNFEIESHLIEVNCAGIMIKVEECSSLIMDDIKISVMSGDMSLNLISPSEYVQNIIDSVGTSYVSIIKIMVIIWVYDTICCINQSTNIILKISKIAPCLVSSEKRYNIQGIRCLRSNLGVPP